MHKKTILIVDDEEKIVEIESLILSMEGYEVLTANDGREAINLLKKLEPPDLILLDILMPNVSGLEVCRWIKQQPKLDDMPIIFLSAVVSQKSREEAMNAGGNEYLEKPFATEDLLELIKKYTTSQSS
ncbi:MAG: response regulator [Candidatus Hodarchaeales archaeon]